MENNEFVNHAHLGEETDYLADISKELHRLADLKEAELHMEQLKCLTENTAWPNNIGIVQNLTDLCRESLNKAERKEQK